MSQTYDITVFRNETFQCTFEYFDSQDLPISLSHTTGQTKLEVRPLNNNDGAAAFSVSTSTTSVPLESGDPVFYFPFPAPNPQSNRFILYIPQPDAESMSLTEGQRYYYDIVVTRAGGSVKDRIVSGRFTLLPGVTDV